MNIAVFSEKSFQRKWNKVLATSSLFDETVEASVRSIMHEVASKGDKAILQFTQQFDGATLKAKELLVTESEFKDAAKQVDRATKAAIKESFRIFRILGRCPNAKGGTGATLTGLV
jgi:histidinol dehydrogenase